jgi:hypothetical protein
MRIICLSPEEVRQYVMMSVDRQLFVLSPFAHLLPTDSMSKLAEARRANSRMSSAVALVPGMSSLDRGTPA